MKRLYLFDIDGTLISTGGAGSKAMAASFRALWGVEDGFARIEFSGRTDRAILRNALDVTGLGADFVADLSRFKRAYFRRLPGSLTANAGTLLPAVKTVLERLAADPDASLGLATGNFRHSAGLKLGYYGIAAYFARGGFGDHTEDRGDMVAEAVRAFGGNGRHDTVFVIGDTVHDIRSAKDNGLVAVGVTTGSYTAEALSEAGADIVLASLEEAEGQLI